MCKQFTPTLLFLLFFGTTTSLSAQGLLDGFFNPTGKASVTAGYTFANFDAFYVGDMRVEGVPAHNEINQNVFSLYANYGITDDLTIVANIPFIDAEGDGVADPVNGETSVSGVQNISVLLKHRTASASFEGGRFDFITALAGNLATGYVSNGILALGNGANTADALVGGQLTLDGGFFVSGNIGYSFRGETDNDLGVSPADSIASVDFDVPNAVIGAAKIGYAGSAFYVEGWFDFQNSTDGVDIMGEGFFGNFPETEVNYTRVGVSAFVPLTSNFGVSAGYGAVVSGRNVSDSNIFSGGLTVSF